MVKNFINTDPTDGYSIEQIIDLKISKAMVPIYWMIGGAMISMISIFLAVALPLQSKLMEVALVQREKAFIKDVDDRFDKVDKKFDDCAKLYVDKAQYFRIESDEHRMLTKLFPNIQSATYVMNEINANILKELGFNYSIRGEEKRNEQ
jgi:hypothetical protein